MKTDLFQSCGHCWVFQICWHIECSPFTASSFRIWNSCTQYAICNMHSICNMPAPGKSEWTPGVGDGQGGLVCCDSWGYKESDTNWTECPFSAQSSRSPGLLASATVISKAWVLSLPWCHSSLFSPNWNQSLSFTNLCPLISLEPGLAQRNAWDISARTSSCFPFKPPSVLLPL